MTRVLPAARAVAMIVLLCASPVAAAPAHQALTRAYELGLGEEAVQAGVTEACVEPLEQAHAIGVRPGSGLPAALSVRRDGCCSHAVDCCCGRTEHAARERANHVPPARCSANTSSAHSSISITPDSLSQR